MGQEVPAARVLASPSGAAKEDNVQREYYFVGTLRNNGAGMAKMLRYITLQKDVTDGRMLRTAGLTDGQRDASVEI